VKLHANHYLVTDIPAIRAGNEQTTGGLNDLVTQLVIVDEMKMALMLTHHGRSPQRAPPWVIRTPMRL